MKNIIVLIFSFLGFSIHAQMQECGTVASSEDMQAYYNRERAPQNNLKAGTVVEIPIVYHLTRRDDGTGGFDLAETFRLHCDLNERFEDAEIHFYILDIIEHNNSDYFNMTYNGRGSVMMNNENNLNACNVFLADEANTYYISWQNNDTIVTSVCGYSYVPMFNSGPNRGGVVLNMGVCTESNSTTLTHEMGHYLNLPHTFDGYRANDPNTWERADGSNCLYTGDSFCDTPADYDSDRWPCTSPNNFTDAIGQIFSVDEKNYMSYSYDGCQQYFKPEQIAEMQNTPSTYRSYLLNLTPPNTDALVSPTLNYPPNNMNNLSLGSINFEWSSVPAATHYLFELTYSSFNNVIYKEVVTTNSISYNNFTAGSSYKWRVKAINYGSVCNEYKEGSFSVSTFNADVFSNDVFCNGAMNGSASVDTTGNDISTFNWYELDAAAVSYNNFSTTTDNIIRNLAPNKYYVEVVKANGDIVVISFKIEEPVELDVTLSQNTNSLLSNVTGGTPPYSFLWSDGSNSSQNNNPIVGENTIYLTDHNGCFVSKSFTFTAGTSAIDDFSNDISNLIVYPNPIKGNKVFINLIAKNIDNVSLELYSVDGKLVREYNRTLIVGENTLELPIEKIGKGVYFMKFLINNNSTTRKIIL